MDWDNYDSDPYLKSRKQYEKSFRYDYNALYERSDSLKTVLLLTDYLKLENTREQSLKGHQAYLTETI